MVRLPRTLSSFALVLAAVPSVLAAPGDLDPTFGGTGTVVTPIGGTSARATAVTRQSDGKLVAAGSAVVPVAGNPDNLDFAVVRYGEDGTPDTSFGGTGIVTTAIRGGDDTAQAVIQQSDGKLVVAGLSYDSSGFNDSTITVVRYLDDGTPDPAWGGTGKVTTAVGPDYDGAYAVIQQGDGKIVVAGYSGSDAIALVRYDTSGNLDATFNGTGMVTTTVATIIGTARALVQQAADDKLVVAGVADGQILLARYGTTGTLDAGFAGGTVVASVGSGAELHALVQQASDGKLVAAGFANNGTNDDFLIVRYGLDGMPDGSFGTSGVTITPVGSGADAAHGLAEQADGALVAAGSSHNGTNLDFAIVRYDTGGDPDATFGTSGIVTTPIGTGEDVANAVLVQPNGGIVAAGYSNSGTEAFALARYLSLAGTTTSTTPTTTTSTTAFVSSTTTLGAASTSTTTVVDTTTTSTLLLLPGGPAGKTSNDCFLELQVRGAVAAAVQKNQIVSCGEGTACDQGASGDGRCEVEIAVCTLQTDPRLPDCTPPASLERVRVGKPFAGATSGLLAGPACTVPVRVTVPLKLSRSGKYRPGKSKLVIKGNARAPKGVPSRKDTDKWTIQCVPVAGASGDAG